ncbi:hypothetical protein FA95DRAFT_1568928 [Auriscalpium vulgare]|uniref:Uncharacterized protein n=1 Tax=Auriscalpium vulgare TaxID=40419 RepID=A0ACB8SAY2_9AGAM|nr:hypothetical protein FA95DRAFT_1568928 [Auriscalpium vulgare]
MTEVSMTTDPPSDEDEDDEDWTETSITQSSSPSTPPTRSRPTPQTVQPTRSYAGPSTSSSITSPYTSSATRVAASAPSTPSRAATTSSSSRYPAGPDPFAAATERWRKRDPTPVSVQDWIVGGRGVKVAFVVAHGQEVGVFLDWIEVSRYTSGFSGARFKGYASEAEANDRFAHLLAIGAVGAPGAYPAQHEEDSFWTVVRGRQPGVFEGRTRATAAVGRNVRGPRVERARSLAEADRIFTREFVAGQVHRSQSGL